MNFLSSSPQLQRVFEALGITLLHSLWQGFLLMLLLWALLRFISYEKAKLRFVFAFGSLMIMLLVFSITFHYEWDSLKPLPSVNQSFSTQAVSQSIELTDLQVSSNPSFWEQIKSETYAIFYQLAENAHLLAIAWLTGSLLFSFRLSLGLWQIHQLKQEKQALPEFWNVKALTLQQALGIRQNVEVCINNTLDSPLTLGWLKPIILFPSSMLTAMPAEQIESILVHELAHIRRHDYLWNLLQSVAEVILFYHPAYWYIASVLEQEREHACDMITLKVTGRPQVYAQALLQVASLRTSFSTVGLSARGRAKGRSGFAERIRRIVAPQQKKKGVQPLPFFFSFCLIGFLLFAFTLKSPFEEQVLPEQEESGSLYDSLRTPDYVRLSSRMDLNITLYKELIRPSSNHDDYIVGMARSSDKEINPRTYLKEDAVYLLDGKIIDDPESIMMSDVAKVEVYHEPLPTALQNLRSHPYSTVVRALSEIPAVQAESSTLTVSGLVQTTEDGKLISIPDIPVRVKSTGEQTVTNANGRYTFAEVGKKDTLLFYLPNSKNALKVPVDNREYLSVTTYIPKKLYDDKGGDILKQRMSPELLKKDREAIQQKVINPKQDATEDKSLRIEGRLIDTENGKALVEKVDFFVGKKNVGSIFEYDGSQFDLQVNQNDDTLFYSFNDFKPKTLNLGQGKNLQVDFKKQISQANTLADPKGYKKLYIVDQTVKDKKGPAFHLYNTDEAVQKFGKGVSSYNSVVAINTSYKPIIKPLQKVISGQVTDATTGQAIPGVNVLISGTTIGTVSNQEGRFQLSIPEEGEELIFKYIGYEDEVIAVEDKDVMQVKLKPLSEEEAQKLREKLKMYYQTGRLEKPLAGTIQVRLVDAESLEPLEGVDIINTKNQEVVARTNRNGIYVLEVDNPDESMQLMYQKEGYLKYQMPAHILFDSRGSSIRTLPLEKMKSEGNKPTIKSSFNLVVFPNPSSDEVKVKFTLSEAGSVEFELLDMEGNFITSFEYHFFKAGEEEISIPTSKLPADTYFLRVKLNGKYEVRRVILK